MRSGRDCYGTINVGRRDRNGFTLADMRKIEALAMWIATLIASTGRWKG
ncbi:hypothetical protein [Bordetella pertussis]